MHDNGGGSKAERTPFLKLYTADWAEGTVGMTFEQEGFYLRLLMLMWARKSMLPNDLDELAKYLRSDRRVIRRLLADLEALGKIVITETEIINQRMKAEIGTREKQVKSATSRANFRRTSATSPAKVWEKSGETQNAKQANSETYSATHDPPIFQKSEIRDQRDITSCGDTIAARASEPKFTDDKISGDGWVIDLKAVDMAAALASMPTDRARQIAQIIALDWSANKTRPQNPMAMVRAALMRDQRSGETHTATVGRKSVQDDHAKRVWAALDKIMPVGGTA